VRIRLSLLAAIAAAAVPCALVGAPAHPSATPLCSSLTVSTAVTPPSTFGPYCVPYSGTPACLPVTTGVGIWVGVDGAVCVPAVLHILSTPDL